MPYASYKQFFRQSCVLHRPLTLSVFPPHDFCAQPILGSACSLQQLAAGPASTAASSAFVFPASSGTTPVRLFRHVNVGSNGGGSGRSRRCGNGNITCQSDARAVGARKAGGNGDDLGDHVSGSEHRGVGMRNADAGRLVVEGHQDQGGGGRWAPSSRKSRYPLGVRAPRLALARPVESITLAENQRSIAPMWRRSVAYSPLRSIRHHTLHSGEGIVEESRVHDRDGRRGGIYSITPPCVYVDIQQPK